MLKEMLKGAAIAAAVGSLLASGASRADEGKEKKDKSASDTVKCAGINECKGHGGCKSASNACAGQNGCKGQSFKETKTEKECKDKGGKVIAQK
jgi:uncharacterized membrane protein